MINLLFVPLIILLFHFVYQFIYFSYPRNIVNWYSFRRSDKLNTIFLTGHTNSEKACERFWARNKKIASENNCIIFELQYVCTMDRYSGKVFKLKRWENNV